MNEPNPSFRRGDVWYAADSGDLSEFAAGIPAETDAADYPHASGIEAKIPIYDGNAIRAMDAQGRKALMQEWAKLLLNGPGVLVIQSAYPDTAPVDRATALFDRIIEEERAAGAGAGDHFAKPGANDRIWNALQKHCLADPEGFALYYGNTCLALAAEAWLGPGYQFTAQVNRVNPGGAAQNAHRDYHLGFMSTEQAARFPAHIHALSPGLTLQGAVAHCDMPVESGPTMLLPYSQRYGAGYIAFTRPDFQAYFAENHAQLPLKKGDAVFFNPALMHGAGTNRTADICRMANLLQISSAMGRAMEAVDRTAMTRALYSPLKALVADGKLTPEETAAAIAACAEGYAFPTNLDSDPPIGGLAPASQADLMTKALQDGDDEATFAAALDGWEERRRP
ncbi:phytanoyl-CoA dioxygenase family protein [Pseudoruegeria sp. HB172150]|uniref:phytanoyl-CoA dioxygenase family protein n=1 Tax=Pseudoruegeria sp. HB172150 TaxID=2721164 RepID=UPI001554C12B|nr:phytanoyl-CoA dioxygenase family protein [Pseudoruegeria sp. HB172150]